MAKYHNSVEGPRICVATVQECRLGDGVHYDNVKDAEVAYQETLKEEFGKFSVLIKRDTKEKVRQASYKAREQVSLNVQKVKASPAGVAAVKKLQEIRKIAKEIIAEADTEINQLKEDYGIAKKAVKDTNRRVNELAHKKISDSVKVTKQTLGKADQAVGRVLMKAGGIPENETWEDVKKDHESFKQTSKMVSEGVLKKASNKAKESFAKLKQMTQTKAQSAKKQARMKFASMAITAEKVRPSDTYGDYRVVSVKPVAGNQTKISYAPKKGGAIVSATVSNNEKIKIDMINRNHQNSNKRALDKLAKIPKTPLATRVKRATAEQKQVFRTLSGKTNPRSEEITHALKQQRMNELLSQMQELRATRTVEQAPYRADAKARTRTFA